MKRSLTTPAYNANLHKYDWLVTDIMGTTTPISEIGSVREYIMANSNVREEITGRLGYTNASEIERILLEGDRLGKEGKKDDPVFKESLKIWDVGAEIGYSTKSLTMGLEADVESAVAEIKDHGTLVGVYSSGGTKASKFGMESNGLDRYISAYFSQQNVGSKTKPEGYLNLAKELGFHPSRLAYVTDTPAEALAAVQAGYGKVMLIDRNAVESGFKDGYEIVNNYSMVTEAVNSGDQNEKSTTPIAEPGAES